MTEDGYLTPEGVAQQLGISVKTVKEYLNDGKLRGDKNPVSGTWVRIAESDLQEFLSGKPAEPGTQEEKVSVDSPTDVTDAKQQTSLAKELAEQAKQQDEEHKAKIAKELRQKGYDTVEAGLADADAKQNEALDILETANRERASVRAELEAVAREKEKAINALAIVKERDRLVNEKWADIMVKEENQKAFVSKYNEWKEELVALAEYHKTHVAPCVKALKTITRTLYTWFDLLNTNTGYDWSELYNYLGRQGKILDNYVDHVEGAMPTFESEEVEETRDTTSPSEVGEE